MGFTHKLLPPLFPPACLLCSYNFAEEDKAKLEASSAELKQLTDYMKKVSGLKLLESGTRTHSPCIQLLNHKPVPEKVAVSSSAC